MSGEIVLPEVMVLTGSRPRARKIGDALGRRGVRIVRVSTLAECRARLNGRTRQLLVADCVEGRLDWRDAWGAACEAGVPMIAIVDWFDSRRWVEMLKAGVLEVLAEPVPRKRLRSAARTALGRRAKAAGHRLGWGAKAVEAMRGWLGLFG